MRRIDGSDLFPKNVQLAAVALGNFDGVHLGHQKLLARANELSKTNGGPSVIYTFEPHPVRILAPSQCPQLLSTLDQKLGSLEVNGVDMAVVEPFTHKFSRMSPGEFFEEIIAKRLRPSSIVVGYDFTFGLHRQGTVELLEALGKKMNINIAVVPAEFSGETLISSTVIRRMISEGRIEEAGKLLGKPYEIVGDVVPGRGLGKSLSARTANLKPLNEIIPADGVYVTLSNLEGVDIPMPSVTSIGDNPTFPDAHYSIETHVLDSDIELLGRKMNVCFLAFMRETLRLSTVDELKAQIKRDIEAAREYHLVTSSHT